MRVSLDLFLYVNFRWNEFKTSVKNASYTGKNDAAIEIMEKKNDELRSMESVRILAKAAAPELIWSHSTALLSVDLFDVWSQLQKS